MTQDEFSTRDVAKILGISERQAIDWAERGLFTADVQPASGLGSRRRFSYGAVLVAKLALELKGRLKIPREQIKFIVKGFQFEGRREGNQSQELMEEQPKSSSLPEIFSESLLVFGDFQTVFQVISREEFDKEYFFNLIHPQRDSDMLVLIDLAKIKTAVDKAIREVT